MDCIKRLVATYKKLIISMTCTWHFQRITQLQKAKKKMRRKKSYREKEENGALNPIIDWDPLCLFIGRAKLLIPIGRARPHPIFNALVHVIFAVRLYHKKSCTSVVSYKIGLVVIVDVNYYVALRVSNWEFGGVRFHCHGGVIPERLRTAPVAGLRFHIARSVRLVLRWRLH